MNSWLHKVLEWGQAAIDEQPVELDLAEGREDLFIAVSESLRSKEHYPPITPKPLSDDQRLLCVPVSGGLDSVTAWEVATRAKSAEVRAFYVQLNTPYAEPEMAAIKKLGIPVTLIDLSTWPQRWEPYQTAWKHILPLRNLAIVAAIAEWTDDRPAEIWLGATDGEIPLTGGDKSLRFFDAVASVLNTFPVRHTLQFPLAKHTKTDLVKWWLSAGLSQERLRATITCQQPWANAGEYVACGSCHACFNRWVAMSNAGLVEEMVVSPLSVEANVEKIAAMRAALLDHDFVTWSERRILQTLEAWKRPLMVASVG